jgi:glycosyltransferase involved in cell wall biosynthesis
VTARVVVDARLLHYNRGGIGQYLRHLYRAMALLPAGRMGGLDFTVLYSRKDDERLLSDAWPRAATAWTPAHHPLERWALAAELIRLRPALVHSPDHVAPQPVGWRSVVTVHDLAFRLLPETHASRSRSYYAGLEDSVRRAQGVICVSEATRRDLLSIAPHVAAKVTVIHEAADPRYGLEGPVHAQGRPYVVFVGTVEPRKNVSAIVRALAALPPGVRPELKIVGAPGAALAEVQDLAASLGLGSDVTYQGRLATPEVAAIYRGALALVYPSLLEGFGLPILEAMACGTPVITSDRSSMPEIAGDAALLVDPTDLASISSAVERVTSDQALRQTLKARGLARAGQFSWSRAAAETLATFQQALA